MLGSHESHHADHLHHDDHLHHADHLHHDDHHFHHGHGHGFHFGLYSYYPYYPYYTLYSHHGHYGLYDYGYGYSPLYNGYYSSYYDYCPPVAYNGYDDSYYPTYSNSTYYYPASAGRVVTHTNTIYTTTPRAPAYVAADDYSDQTYGDGWSYLANGQDRTAFRYFSRQASRHIDDGQPKLGYAIASALLGEDGRAVWAMRRAFNIDPYSLTTVRFDEQLLGRIDQLAEHYAQQADEASDRDADFMLAALSFLLGDNSLASIAIDNALAHGDDSDATVNLKAMIAETPDAEDDYP